MCISDSWTLNSNSCGIRGVKSDYRSLSPLHQGILCLCTWRRLANWLVGCKLKAPLALFPAGGTCQSDYCVCLISENTERWLLLFSCAAINHFHFFKTSIIAKSHLVIITKGIYWAFDKITLEILYALFYPAVMCAVNLSNIITCQILLKSSVLAIFKNVEFYGNIGATFWMESKISDCSKMLEFIIIFIFHS